MVDEVRSITPGQGQFLAEGQFFGEMDDIEAKTYGRDTDKRKPRSVDRQYEDSGGKQDHGTLDTKHGISHGDEGVPYTDEARYKTEGLEPMEEVQTLFDEDMHEPVESIEGRDAFHHLKKYDGQVSDALEDIEGREKATEEADKKPENGEVTTISDEDPGASWMYRQTPR